MATLYKTDGTTATVTPKQKTKWTLDELQALVGGDVEPFFFVKPYRFIVNEEGRVRALPFNQTATELVRARIDAIGEPVTYMPRFFGDVVLLDKGERF